MNSNLEALGFTLAFFALETHMPVAYQHVTLHCNITPTISWVQKLSVKLERAACLIRILAIRMKIARTLLLLLLSIASVANAKSDYASRHFFYKSDRSLDTIHFIQTFNSLFPSMQDYKLKTLLIKLQSKATSEM